jgi:hypothetical protein
MVQVRGEYDCIQKCSRNITEKKVEIETNYFGVLLDVLLAGVCYIFTQSLLTNNLGNSLPSSFYLSSFLVDFVFITIFSKTRERNGRKQFISVRLRDAKILLCLEALLRQHMIVN